MITGTVNANRQPLVRLVVRGPSGQEQDIEGLVDTGYNGFITVSPGLAGALGLVRLGRGRATLADGRQELLDIYEGTVLWEGSPRTVEVDAADTVTLLGMALLDGHDLHIRAVIGGSVTISAIP
jgi:clan AA aspartic protease